MGDSIPYLSYSKGFLGNFTPLVGFGVKRARAEVAAAGSTIQQTSRVIGTYDDRARGGYNVGTNFKAYAEGATKVWYPNSSFIVQNSSGAAGSSGSQKRLFCYGINWDWISTYSECRKNHT